MAPVLVWHHVSFSMALVLQLQLWHIQRLVSTGPKGNLPSYMPWALHFLSHGDAAPSLDNLQYQLDCYWFQQLRACHCILHHVGIVINNMVEKCVTPFDGDVSQKLSSQDICCMTFFNCFLTRNHTMESFCLNFVSLCTLIKCGIFSNTL
jgi:hypothetical protein